MRNAGIEIKFVTNTSKESLRDIHERISKLNFNIRKDEIFTSLTAVRKLVDARNIRPHLVLADSAMEDFEGKEGKDVKPINPQYTSTQQSIFVNENGPDSMRQKFQ